MEWCKLRQRLLAETAGDFISTCHCHPWASGKSQTKSDWEEDRSFQGAPPTHVCCSSQSRTVQEQRFLPLIGPGALSGPWMFQIFQPHRTLSSMAGKGNLVSCGKYMLFPGNSSWPWAWREPSCLAERDVPLSLAWLWLQMDRRALPTWERPGSPRDEGLGHIMSAGLRPAEVAPGSKEHLGWGMEEGGDGYQVCSKTSCSSRG